ncbi:MAG: OB-fold domain-containing protein [Chloroflexota bacterium]
MTSYVPPKRPIPVPDDLTRGFWEAAGRGALAAQHCDDCNFYTHPPRTLCGGCGSPAVAWKDVSGKGKIYSWAVMRMQSVQGFEQSVPYCTLLVELDEQPKLLLAGYLPGEGEGLSIGAPVEVFFEDIEGSDLKLPNFRLVK